MFISDSSHFGTDVVNKKILKKDKWNLHLFDVFYPCKGQFSEMCKRIFRKGPVETNGKVKDLF